MFYPQPQVAAVRMTQWAKLLGEFGWKVTVMCQDFGYRADRQQVHDELGSHVDIEYFNQHKPITTAGTKLRFKQWVQRRFGIQQWWVPDRSIRLWRKYETKILATYDRVKPGVVLTSSPPHSIHEIGLMIKRQRDAKWIADFRDPWLIDSRFQPRGFGKLIYSRHRQFEQSVYENADLLTCAIPVHGRWIKANYPSVRERVAIITNGIPDELLENKIEPIWSKEDVRSIRIIGNPGGEVLDSISSAVEILNRGDQKIELLLVGSKPPNVNEIQTKLGSSLTLTGPVEHKKALAYILGADLLVCPLAKERSQSLLLSSKLFEYIASGVPSVVINPTKSDHLFFGKRPELHMVSNVDAQSLATIFEELAGKQIETDQEFVKQYRRKNQAEELAELLSNLESAQT